MVSHYLGERTVDDSFSAIQIVVLKMLDSSEAFEVFLKEKARHRHRPHFQLVIDVGGSASSTLPQIVSNVGLWV